MIGALLLLLAAPAQPPVNQGAYDQALGAHASHDARKAAALLYAWMQTATRTAENYETAEQFLAEDLQALGLTHAALVFEGDVVRDRARPELIPVALNHLQAWTLSTPHDEERVEEELLHGGELGSLEGSDARAQAYVAYFQGALDLRAGEERWANASFAALPANSPERGRAALLVLASQLQRGADKLGELEALANNDAAARETRNEAHIEAGRLRFEAGEYPAALAHYQAVVLAELDPGRGQIYLEEAWAEYRLGHGGRAMGLLAALDAPSFRALFLPEKFLLRALIYKDACQWLGAKRAARALSIHYAKSLAAIRDRAPLIEDPALAEAALQKGAGKRAAALVEELTKERERLEQHASAWKESGLLSRLNGLYADEQGEAERRRELALEKGALEAANELLAATEQAGLADYEVGLALYRRGRDLTPANVLAFESAQPGDGEVGFKFDGEYWNDELPQLRFSLINRCVQGAAP